MEYTNRYGDVYTFTKQENGDVLWEGNFEYCRFGWPNVYKEAYQQYRKDGGDMHIEEFEKAVHEYNDEKSEYTPLAKQYGPLVYSDTNTIDMVDPSGGPYLSTHTNLYERFGDDELKGLCISSFEPIETGYKIHTYGEFDHLKERTDE
jgi:hypothetical protein